MPIEYEELSNQTAMSLVGHLRLGKEMEEGREHPEKTSYFRFDPEDESLLPTLHKLFGEKPKRLRVIFLSGDLEDIFPQYLMKFGAPKRKKGQKLKERTSFLVCKGTGGVDRDGNPKPAICRLVDKETGEMVDDYPCDPANCSDYQSGRCKRVAFLSGFILTEFPTLRTWQVNTTGKHSIRNLNTRLRALQDLARAGGRGSIAGLPLVLSLKPGQSRRYDKKTGKPMKGKWTYYEMDLDIDMKALTEPGQALQNLQRMMLAGEVQRAPLDLDVSRDGFFPRSQVQGVDVQAERIEMAEEDDGEDDPVLANIPDDIAEGLRVLRLTRARVRNLVLRYLEPGETVLRAEARKKLFKYVSSLADLMAAGDDASLQAHLATLDLDETEAEVVEDDPGFNDEALKQEIRNNGLDTNTFDGEKDEVDESSDPLGLGDI